MSHAMPELDSRCENWGRWARPEATFLRLARACTPGAPKEWDPEWGDPYESAPYQKPDPVDHVDAPIIDSAVSRLAEPHRGNLTLFYIKMSYVPIGPYYAAMRALNDRLSGRFHEARESGR